MRVHGYTKNLGSLNGTTETKEKETQKFDSASAGSYLEHLKDFQNPRKTLLLFLGTLSVGVGIGLLILTELGASPIDAAVVNIAILVGLSVGTVLLLASFVMLVIAYIVGKLKPVIGTIVSFIGISLSIDIVILLGGDIINNTETLFVRVPFWILGAVLLGLGAAALIAAQLGASPYDQMVQSITRFGLSIPQSRIVLDIVMISCAFLLGGASIGFGTLGLLLLVPFLLKLLIPRFSNWISLN
jgi:uncharacterized membrane protein YczE